MMWMLLWGWIVGFVKSNAICCCIKWDYMQHVFNIKLFESHSILVLWKQLCQMNSMQHQLFEQSLNARWLECLCLLMCIVKNEFEGALCAHHPVCYVNFPRLYPKSNWLLMTSTIFTTSTTLHLVGLFHQIGYNYNYWSYNFGIWYLIVVIGL